MEIMLKMVLVLLFSALGIMLGLLAVVGITEGIKYLRKKWSKSFSIVCWEKINGKMVMITITYKNHTLNLYINGQHMLEIAL